MRSWRSDGAHVRKAAPIALDLNGIAKGYGVDRLAETLRDHGIGNALVGIDGEMRAMGLRPDGAGLDHRDRGAGRRAPGAPFDPRAAGRRRGDLGRLPPLGRGAGTTPVAHDGPEPRRTADRVAGLRHRRGPHLCRGRWLGDGAHGARARSGRGARKTNTGSTPCSSCAMMTAAQGAWESDDFFPKSQRQSPRPRGDEPHGTRPGPIASRPPSCCWPQPA